jgi:hypothetical protein
MKPLLLIVTPENTDTRYIECDTVKDAQTFAEQLAEPANFEIFALYSVGSRTIKWDLATDHATNLRENARAKAKPAKKISKRAGAWSLVELNAAVNARRKGMPLQQIADKLGRSYNSVYMKLQKEKKKAK